MTSSAARAELRLLIVDDSATDAELLQLLLHDRGMPVQCAHAKNAEQLRALLEAGEPDVVISDINMPGFGGAQAHALVRQLRPRARFCFMSDAPDYANDLPDNDGVLRKDQIDELIALLEHWLAPASG